MSSGRVVVLSDGVRLFTLVFIFSSRTRPCLTLSFVQHFRDNPAVLLKAAPAAVLPSGMIDPTKQFFVLAFVPPEIRAAKNGTSPSLPRLSTSIDADSFRPTIADVAANAVPPRWPPRPTTASEADELTYELAVVPLTSVSLVTNLTLKVSSCLLSPSSSF